MSMTPEQVENWRNVLFNMIGPYAFYVPVEDIQKFRDLFQERINQIAQEIGGPVNSLCSCDPRKHGATTKRSGEVVCNKCQKPRQTGGG